MRWKAMILSMKLAWQRPFFKWSTLVIGLLLVSTVSLFLIRVIPVARRDGMAVLHYNIYLGADNVQDWGWTFLLPAVWFVTTLGAWLWAGMAYHRDRHLTYALIAVNLLGCLPWIGALFYLTLVNQ